MKQRLLKALSLAAIALCSVSSAWADRVAPTLPPAVEPQNEQDYGLYCPEANKYMSLGDYYSGNYKATLSESNFYRITLTPHNSHYVLHQGTSACLVPNGDEGNWFGANWKYAASPYFDLIKNGEGYHLQNTNNNKFVSFSGDIITFEQEATVTWLFVDAEKATHYFAEKNLYNALNATDNLGWDRNQYEQIYNNRATATNLELNQAAKELTYVLNLNAVSGLFDPQNDYTNLVINSSQEWKVSGNHLEIYLKPGESAAITAAVETTEKADLSYRIRSYSGPVHVFVDGEKVRTIFNESTYGNQGMNWFEALEPGKHVIKWLYENTTTGEHWFYFDRVGVENTPLITVNCPLPGSLGTEILYNVNSVKDVRNLKVIGDLNDEDMTRLTMLTNAHYIDLSEATCTAGVPERGFYSHAWLHTLHLAEGIKSIGASAFSKSVLENITLPSTLESINSDAFFESNLKSIEIPNSVTSMGNQVFYGCNNFENVIYSNGVTSVPNGTFYNCHNLKPFEIPEGVTTIGYRAFVNCM